MRFWSGSDDNGLRSTLDSTVHRISSKFSVELDLFKKKQGNRGPMANQNMTTVEEVSVVDNLENNNNNSDSVNTNVNNRDQCIKDVLVVQQLQPGGMSKCTAVAMQRDDLQVDWKSTNQMQGPNTVICDYEGDNNSIEGRTPICPV